MKGNKDTFVQPLLQYTINKYYIFWVCVCSHNYPARNARAPFYILSWFLSGCTIYLHLIW